MVVCGSAFACDVVSVLPANAKKNAVEHVHLNSDPIIGDGTTDIVTAANEEVGVCRDAGIDFNVPLPPMTAEAQREFYVILVMDAGAGSKNASELNRAVALGYLELTVCDAGKGPLDPYPIGECVRVFRRLKGAPTILLLLGANRSVIPTK